MNHWTFLLVPFGFAIGYLCCHVRNVDKIAELSDKLKASGDVLKKAVQNQEQETKEK